MSATLVVGSQWGDECKGKISAHIMQKNNIKYIYKAGIGPNAEHGLYFEANGPYIKCNQLPLGFIRQPNSLIRIGSGVCVDPIKLQAEIKLFKLEGRVKIDPRCPIVFPEHIQWERDHLVGNSTYNGCGPCRADFALRKATQAKDIPELKDLLLDVAEEINYTARHEPIMIECSQGAMLSLALSHSYPHVTSDNVTTAAAIDDVGLNWQLLEHVIMVVKSIPSREGGGPMGNVPEMSLDKVKGSQYQETSSVDAAIRRKAYGIDFDLLRYAAMINGPTEIALTFLDQFDPKMANSTDKETTTDSVRSLIQKVEFSTFAPVTMLETGKLYNSIIDI